MSEQATSEVLKSREQNFVLRLSLGLDTESSDQVFGLNFHPEATFSVLVGPRANISVSISASAGLVSFSTTAGV